MSALEDTSGIGLLETEISSTDNLKELALTLIQDLNMYMREYDEWIDELPLVEVEDEELELIPFDIERPSLLG